MNYEELVNNLRAHCTPNCNFGCCTLMKFENCSEVMAQQAADAIEELQKEVKRLSNTFVIPEEHAITVCGYPVKELTAFASLCRRHEITEDDLHDFCTNALRGFEAGKNDFHVVIHNMFPEPPKEEA